MSAILSDAALLACVQELVVELTGKPLPQAIAGRIAVVPARLAVHGDLYSDAALLSAGAAGEPVGVFAERLARRLAGLPGLQTARVAGPGFINMTGTERALDGVLPMLLGRPRFGLSSTDVPRSPPAGMCHDHADFRRSHPDFMVQYAHARCRSVLRAVGEVPDLERLIDAARGCFVSDPFRRLLCRLDHWTRLADTPAHALGELHDYRRITLFLRDLSFQFDRVWKAPGDDAILRLLDPGQPSRSLATIALVLATADVIRSGLDLLGLDAAEELR